MSTEGSSTSELMTAIQLTKLRSKALGFEMSEEFSFAILEEMNKFIVEIIEKQDTPQATRIFMLQSMVQIFAKTADTIPPYKIEEIRKFLSGLNALHLNTDEEKNKLLEIENQFEQLIQSLRIVENQLINIQFLSSQNISDLTETSKKLMNTYEKLTELKRQIDKRILDSLSIISRTMVSVGSEELFKLFTQEP